MITVKLIKTKVNTVQKETFWELTGITTLCKCYEKPSVIILKIQQFYAAGLNETVDNLIIDSPTMPIACGSLDKKEGSRFVIKQKMASSSPFLLSNPAHVNLIIYP
jgi:hypothetical protein